MGKFHGYGLSNADFARKIGLLVLSKYDDDPLTEDDDNCVLVIPCYHPGRVQYGGDTGSLFGKVLTKVYAIAWLAMGRAMDLAYHNRHISKKDLLLLIKQEVDNVTGPDTEYGQALGKSQSCSPGKLEEC